MSTPCVLLGTSRLSIISVFADQKKKSVLIIYNIIIIDYIGEMIRFEFESLQYNCILW